MQSKKKIYFIAYSFFLIGALISGYLLFTHFKVLSGQDNISDLCKVIFNKGCTNASFSNLSSFLNIPLGGWGLIYVIFLGLLILQDHLFTNFYRKELVVFAFWTSAVGVSFSIYYSIYMILHPVFFCPFCAIFHAVNIILLLIIKRISSNTYSQLFQSILNSLKYFFLGKSLNTAFEKWKWLAFLIPFLVSLILYQWIRIEGLAQTITSLAKYDPLKQLENFDAQSIAEINLNAETPLAGDPDAPVSLVVFSDFQCPNCRMFALNFEQLIKYNDGKLNIRFKYFPLNSRCNPLVDNNHYSLACEAAYAVEAAHQQGKFWEYHDFIYSKNLNNFTEEILFDVAKSLNLDMEKFTSDFFSDKCRSKIQADISEGIKLEIDGTPSVFLNGKTVYDLRPENLAFLVKYLSNNLEYNSSTSLYSTTKN